MIVEAGGDVNEGERAALVRQVTTGDAETFQRLYVHYHGVLHGKVAACIRADMRVHVDPDDVLQQACESAFKEVKGCKFDGPGGFYKWLERIALNQAKRDQQRIDSEKAHFPLKFRPRLTAATTYVDLFHTFAAKQDTPSRILAKSEAAAAMIFSLARLTDDQRTVVRMRFLEERSVAEVAAALGKTEPAVHMLCYRGLKELHKHMVSISRYLTG